MPSPTIFVFPVALASALTIATTPVDPILIPPFGLAAGQQPDGSGSCAGANSISIPCFCPPDRERFIEKMNSTVVSGTFLGTPIIFNTDSLAQSDEDNFNRATACLIILQSFNGTRGVGCPAASAPIILDQQKYFAYLLGGGPISDQGWRIDHEGLMSNTQPPSCTYCGRRLWRDTHKRSINE
jgi:hypothetical protein